MAAGVGVTLLPRLALTSMHPGVVARALSRPRRGAASGPPGTRAPTRSPASEAMLQILRDVAEEFAESRLELAAS